jgi:trk system potassium uptake protein TrkH
MPATILFFLAFVGGCAGSTTGGIKVFRFQCLFADALCQVRRLLRPHAV